MDATGNKLKGSDGQFFVTDRDGNQICYKFAKGQPGACSEPCADQRAHACQICLGQRPNVQCQKKGKKGDGKGKCPAEETMRVREEHTNALGDPLMLPPKNAVCPIEFQKKCEEFG